MSLVWLDWLIIVFFLGVTLFIGLYYSKRAGKNITEFFLSGRSLPWYVAGISMVATTFAADTPLAVTELVAKNGIAGNWLWWNMLTGGMLTVFFFAILWRRAGVLTEVELIELRYSGKAASLLRLFKAVYLGLFMNILILGWVNLAFMSVLEVFFGLDKTQAFRIIFLLMILVALYSSLSGLWGVAVNDMVQFAIAMTGSIVLAVFVLKNDAVGGIHGLREKLPDNLFRFFPHVGSAGSSLNAFSMSLATFLAYIGVQWWASWYPGAEPGGGGYIAQRMMSAKNEWHSFWATLLFQIAHYCLRPWPWIVVALASLILYPQLGPDEKRLGYVMAMNEWLPAGWKGLMLVAFTSAYMSTVSTQLNWGSSYLTNDFLFKLSRKLRNQVSWSRLVTLVLAICSVLVVQFMTTISGVWRFIIECGAGLGLVLILRWYWWRINVWSEIAATLAPFVFYALARFVLKMEFPYGFYLTVLGTTITWLFVTFLTQPENSETLHHFYQTVKPAGWWSKIIPDHHDGIDKKLVLSWLAAVIFTYSILFSTGKWILHFYREAVIYGLIALVSFFILFYLMKNKMLGSKENSY